MSSLQIPELSPTSRNLQNELLLEQIKKLPPQVVPQKIFPRLTAENMKKAIEMADRFCKDLRVSAKLKNEIALVFLHQVVLKPGGTEEGVSRALHEEGKIDWTAGKVNTGSLVNRATAAFVEEFRKAQLPAAPSSPKPEMQLSAEIKTALESFEARFGTPVASEPKIRDADGVIADSKNLLEGVDPSTLTEEECLEILNDESILASITAIPAHNAIDEIRRDKGGNMTSHSNSKWPLVKEWGKKPGTINSVLENGDPDHIYMLQFQTYNGVGVIDTALEWGRGATNRKDTKFSNLLDGFRLFYYNHPDENYAEIGLAMRTALFNKLNGDITNLADYGWTPQQIYSLIMSCADNPKAEMDPFTALAILFTEHREKPSTPLPKGLNQMSFEQRKAEYLAVYEPVVTQMLNAFRGE